MTDDYAPWVGNELSEEELRGAFADVQRCPVCDTERCLYVQPNEYGSYNWYVVPMHDNACPMLAGNVVPIDTKS